MRRLPSSIASWHAGWPATWAQSTRWRPGAGHRRTWNKGKTRDHKDKSYGQNHKENLKHENYKPTVVHGVQMLEGCSPQPGCCYCCYCCCRQVDMTLQPRSFHWNTFTELVARTPRQHLHHHAPLSQTHGCDGLLSKTLTTRNPPVEQQALCRQAIPASPARLLVIVLGGLG